MNYEYFYLFKYATEFDFIIVSTELQKIELEKYLLGLNLSSCPIVVIPAASIEGLTVGNKERIPFSAMLAARLDPRKQIDLAILAAIKVKEKLPHFHLNIYGKGSQYDKLNQIILENNAQEYIKLCGYQKLTDEFKKYQLYLSTSAWETLGITLLEAVANGLGIVGLDAPYGGPTFIENTNNGYLIAENESKSRDELIENISEAIIKYYELDQDIVTNHSYAIASNYLDEVMYLCMLNRYNSIADKVLVITDGIKSYFGNLEDLLILKQLTAINISDNEKLDDILSGYQYTIYHNNEIVVREEVLEEVVYALLKNNIEVFQIRNLGEKIKLYEGEADL